MYEYIKKAVDNGDVMLEWDYSKGQVCVCVYYECVCVRSVMGSVFCCVLLRTDCVVVDNLCTIILLVLHIYIVGPLIFSTYYFFVYHSPRCRW